jgi:pimeloyl-ACP methyl ester carboxylesterase
VTLDPSCPLGHHAFADSANNGPVGQALIAEFIPELDRQFRTVAAPTARFVTGHSSGGWSSLWLQVTYPDEFGGTWSTSPDPVDFRDFQQINLYRPGENMYRDRVGNRRPLAREEGLVRVWYDDFDHMEEVIGPGGQLHSFEAVFSPKGADGRPVRVWDRKTGRIDTDAARTWEKYDIRLILERHWAELGPKLAGKLHVIQGELDTFYLDGATRLLKQSLAALKSDAVIEIVPGRDHSDLATQELALRFRAEMTERFLKHHAAAK